MNDPLDPPSPPQPLPPRVDQTTSHGAYATGLVVLHTRDEFMLDFIAGFASPPQVVGRVVATPAHLKRMLKALLDNFGRYEKTFGAIPVKPENTRAKAGQVSELYAKLQVVDGVLGGAYSNAMAVMHTRDEFIMDFLTNFPPVSKVTSRVVVNPTHLRRIISVLGDNLSQYEDRFGKIDDGSPPTEPRAMFNLN
ncbi:MAG: DUF3467 domain-containing protein [Nitrospirota bacterium]